MSYGSTDLSALTNPILSPSAALKPLIIAPPLPNLFSKFNNLIFGCFLDISPTMLGVLSVPSQTTIFSQFGK